MEQDDAHQLDLMSRVAAGDEEGFGALYDCFERSLYALGLRMLRDPGRAEELVQDTMMKVWRSAASFDGSKGHVSAWIFTLARRTGIDLIRKHARTPTPIESAAEAPDLNASEEESWRDWEIAVLLGGLPEDQRVPVEMNVIQGYTQAEVATSLGLPLGTVKTRIYSGLRGMRQKIEQAQLNEAAT